MKKWRPGIILAVTVIAVSALALFAAACGGDSATGGSSSSPAAEGGTIVGAGASFPAPLYSKWGQEYNAVSGMKLNYQSIGSGGGISAIEAKTVDFGASDAPLEEADLEANGLVQFPMIVGGVVPVVNLEGDRLEPAQAHGRRARRHLHGRDHDLERPGDHEPEPRRQAAVDQDQRRASLGRLRHHLDLHATTSPPRPATSGRPAPTRRSPGPSASAARATRASPPACSS